MARLPRKMLAGLDLGDSKGAVAAFLVKLYACYCRHDAELLEVNPLAVLSDGRLVALDCKFVLDDSGIKRQPAFASVRYAGTVDRPGGAWSRSRPALYRIWMAASACSPMAPALL